VTSYRVDFTVTRREDGDGDFTEIGFGSSGAWDTVDQAAHIAHSAIQNRDWETTGGMPDPDSVDKS
jgi:hypothetical protein